MGKTINITKVTVKALPFASEESKKPDFYFDERLKGFGVKVTKFKKIFIIQSRLKGKSIRFTIGHFPECKPSDAREIAIEKIAEIRSGENPNIQKRVDVEVMKTVRDARDKRVSIKSLSESTIRGYEKHLTTSFHDWQDKPLNSITEKMVKERFAELSKKSHAQANQAFKYFSAWFNTGIAEFTGKDDERIIKDNPVNLKGRWHKITPKRRKIPVPLIRDGKVVESGMIGNTMMLFQEINKSPILTTNGKTQLDAVIFMLFTGSRWINVRELRWEDVDLAKGTWFIPKGKSGESRLFPLSTQIVELLKNRYNDRLSGLPGEFVFGSRQSKSGHIVENRGVIDRVSEVSGSKISAHDFRRTFKAIADILNIEIWRTELLMGHKLNASTILNSYTDKVDVTYLWDDIQKIADFITGEFENLKDSKEDFDFLNNEIEKMDELKALISQNNDNNLIKFPAKKKA